MDPKSLSNIDPKLRETYARVMGTAASGASAPASPPPPISAVTNNIVVPPTTTHADAPSLSNDSVPLSDTPTGAPSVKPSETPPSLTINTSVAPAAGTAQSPFAAAPVGVQQTVKYEPLPSPASVSHDAHGSTSPLLKTLYILGAIVFFVIYTIFWIKIFKLPFFF